MTSFKLPRTTERSSAPRSIMIKGKIHDLEYIDISETYDRSWDMIFKNTDYTIEELLERLYRNGYAAGMKVYPYPEEVLSVFKLPIDRVKVVIIAPEPYNGWDNDQKRPMACGKSYATLSEKCPGQLERIIISIKEQFGYIEFTDNEHQYSLKGWIDQGVLLLNKIPVSYVDRNGGAPNHSAADIWHGMTELICSKITEINPRCQFLLIGREAHELEPKLKSCIKTSQPSMKSYSDFTGECFRRIQTIDWTIM